MGEHEKGAQRLSIAALKRWEDLKYGMFICFNMDSYRRGTKLREALPIDNFSPARVDTDQWIQIARDAGMKYALLTAKQVAGFSLWPSKYTDYHVGNSPYKEDIIAKFVDSCAKYGVLPALYYCSWDEHHLFGSLTPSMTDWYSSFTTAEYQQFQMNQLEELLTSYGKLLEVWIDIPHVLPRGFRHELYYKIAAWQPETIILYNHGLGEMDGYTFNVPKAWPTDVLTIEKNLPRSTGGLEKWREIEGKRYYMPAEVCETLTDNWFFDPEAKYRSPEELLGMYLVARQRGANILLNAAPDRDGLIPEIEKSLFLGLKDNLQTLNFI